ncbi:RNA/RNP complex-1-interacting phosphatase [Stigmatopora nigra]
MPGKKGGIPDRWLKYDAVGKRLHGTRFVAFKVPLKQSFNRLLEPSQIFGPQELLETLWGEGHELGLIIDLTYTNRYYGPSDLPPGLKWTKIVTAGHVIPKKKTIADFKKAVQQFLRDNADNDKLIGVHCTHGLNRTGYMVCRYLIDVDNMDPGEAINLFNRCRGHDMERQNYINNLLEKSNDDGCTPEDNLAEDRHGAKQGALRSAGGPRSAGRQPPRDRRQEEANWTSHRSDKSTPDSLAGGRRGAGRQPPQDRWQKDANWSSHVGDKYTPDSLAGGRRGAEHNATGRRDAGRPVRGQRGSTRRPQDRRQEDANWFSRGGNERTPDSLAGGRRGAGWQPRDRRQEDNYGFSQRRDPDAWTQRGHSPYGFPPEGNTKQRRPSHGQRSWRPQLEHRQAPTRSHTRWGDDGVLTESKSCW